MSINLLTVARVPSLAETFGLAELSSIKDPVFFALLLSRASLYDSRFSD